MRIDPRATYRLQLHAGFGFEDAARVVPYLATLGISHVYASPILQAVAGSSHGYDVVDHGSFNAELGGEAGFRRLVAELTAHQMALLVDIVPNHMAIGLPANRWWWDVLKHGAASRYARAFDVDWRPPEPRLRDTILLPVLPDHYGRVLEAGGLRLERRDGELVVTHGEASFPIDPATVPPALAGDDITAEIDRLNGDPDALDRLIAAQNWRLARWTTASRDLGYRRFFDIDSLIGLRMEDPAVFEATHQLIVTEVLNGSIDGLRVDHPDGLRDPTDYFGRLRAVTGDAWLLAEKILEPGEALPEAWPIDGTTGYDFANLALGVFVDPAAEAPLTELYVDYAGEPGSWAEVAHECKLLALHGSLGSDLNRLTDLLLDICEANRRYRDYTRHELHEALAEVIASFDVYRTYVRPGSPVTDADRRCIDRAVAGAREQRPDLDPELFDFLQRILCLEFQDALTDELVMRFQQLTPPAMAKGVEDTAFYRYNRFVALNEVGGDPGRFGRSVDEFHRWCQLAAARRPRSMLAGTTHDTKRGEDVRARLVVLSQRVAEWKAAISRWTALGDRHRGHADPDRNIEYLLYQTLVGAWPISAERVAEYLRKAAREAKRATSWTAPDEAYEAALDALVRGLLADDSFVADLDAFVAALDDAARRTSLGLLLLRLTAPGVPDVYQGSELWERSLVDPDNRRPVDYELRQRLLAGARDGGAVPWPADADGDAGADGAAKLWLLQRVLEIRRQRAAAFEGGYRPLPVDGSHRDRVVAFLRGEELAVVVPRLVADVHDWSDTTVPLPPGTWRNLLSGADIRSPASLAELLAGFPVALLGRQ